MSSLPGFFFSHLRYLGTGGWGEGGRHEKHSSSHPSSAVHPIWAFVCKPSSGGLPWAVLQGRSTTDRISLHSASVTSNAGEPSSNLQILRWVFLVITF